MRFLGLAFALFVFAVANNAAALKFFPNRLVLSDRDRTATLTIVNSGSQTQRYTLRWTRMRMVKGAGLEMLDEDEPAPDLNPAHDFVLYAPRRAVVPPNGTQTVRFMARPPADLAEGEYRSHLVVTQPPSQEGDGAGDGQGAGTRIETVSRTTIPVILRHGDLTLDVGVKAAGIDRSGDRAQFEVTLERTGTKSLYGDVEILWRDGDGRELVVNEINGVGIYPEINERTFRHVLFFPNRGDVPSGTLHYRLYEHTEDGISGELLAETKVRVP